jgi:hypothetical protein
LGVLALDGGAFVLDGGALASGVEAGFFGGDCPLSGRERTAMTQTTSPRTTTEVTT